MAYNLFDSLGITASVKDGITTITSGISTAGKWAIDKLSVGVDWLGSSLSKAYSKSTGYIKDQANKGNNVAGLLVSSVEGISNSVNDGVEKLTSSEEDSENVTVSDLGEVMSVFSSSINDLNIALEDFDGVVLKYIDLYDKYFETYLYDASLLKERMAESVIKAVNDEL